MCKKIVFAVFSLLIIGLIVISRFWQLGSLPPGIHIDEVSFGYEAQSLYETGKDTWGKSWPQYFKGFGEYKAPGVIYSYLALIPIFGGHISTLITRLPSAIAGIITIIFFVLTAKHINPRFSKITLIIIGLFFAFSPWNFNMSRVYYETSAGFVFIAAGIYYGIKTIANGTKKNWFIMLILFGLSGYFYSSYRYIAFVLIFINYWLFSKKVINIKLIFQSLVLFSVISIGWIPYIISNEGLSRLSHFSSQQKYGDSLAINEKREYCYLSFDRNAQLVKPCYLLWNKPVMHAIDSINTFSNFISTAYLFSSAPFEYGHDSSYGAFLPPLLLLYLLGIIALFTHTNLKYRIYISSIIIIGFMPAVVVGELGMHRVMTGFYGISLLLLLGLSSYRALNINNYLKYIISLIFCLSTLFFIIQSQAHYFLVFTRSSETIWRSDIPETYKYIKNISTDYDSIINVNENLSNMVTPLYAGFFSDLRADEIHRSGIFSENDSMGWTFLYSAGKYQYYSKGLDSLLCKHIAENSKRRILIITDRKPSYESIRKHVSKSFNGVHVLAEVYSLSDIIEFEKQNKTNFVEFCKGVKK